MNEFEISDLIDTILEGVAHSQLGPIFTDDDCGQRVINNASYAAFTTLLSALCPRAEFKMSGEIQEKSAQ